MRTLLTLCLGTLILGWASRCPAMADGNQQLLALATPVVSTVHWADGNHYPLYPGYGHDYLWLTSSRLLHYTNSGKTDKQISVCDVRQGTDTPVAQLTPLSNDILLGASSNGNWILAVDTKGHLVLVCADGAYKSVARQLFGANAVWVPGRDEIATIDYLGSKPVLGAIVYDTAFRVKKQVPFGISSEQTDIVAALNSNDLLLSDAPLPVAQSDLHKQTTVTLATVHWHMTVTLATVHLTKSSLIPDQIRMPLSNMRHAQSFDIFVSPNGRRMLVVYVWYPQDARVQRLSLPQRVEFWTYDIPSGRHHKLGGLFIKPNDDLSDDIQWLPDGKRISFVLNHELYTVATR